MRRRFSIRMLWILLVGVGVFAIGIVAFQPFRPKAVAKIYIRADGSIDPPLASIETVDNITYTFTDNINGSIIVMRNHTVIDGAGFIVQGNGAGDGFTLLYVINVTIKNAEVTAFERGIFLEGSDYNTVSGNNITANNDYGIYLPYSDKNTIHGNHITNNRFGINLYSVNQNTIYSNNVTSYNDYGIRLGFFHKNAISRNNITNSFSGAHYEHSSNNTICGNNIVDNVYGVYLDSSNSNTVSNNNITNNKDGIYLNSSSDNTILGNNITTNKGTGIKLISSSNNTVSQNNIIDSRFIGIYLQRSMSNIISENTILNNDIGVALESASSNTTISGNTIANNSWLDIFLGRSPYNIIYHNNFANDFHLASLDSDNTTWDNGCEGNYWSDYLERYPNASELGDSGLWDTPYVINEDNVDNYPIIPEFPSLILLPLFILGTLFTTIIYQRKQKADWLTTTLITLLKS